MNQKTRRDMEGLLTSLLEETLTAEQKACLEDLLRNDWECRRFYLESLDHHARLLTAPVISTGKLGQAGTAKLPRRPVLRQWLTVASIAAAVVLTGLAFLAGGHLIPTEETKEQTGTGCAVISQLHDAVFETGTMALEPGVMLTPGNLNLKSGMVAVEFFSGATLLAEGEVKLDILSAWEASCDRGKVRVRVPPPAQGFRLHAPGMKLVDLGTEFGLDVSATGSAEVHVFEGEVEAYPLNAGMRRLTEGQSLRRENAQSLTHGHAQPEHFTSIENLKDAGSKALQARYDAYWNHTLKIRRDARLVACYLFKRWEEDRWNRLVNNFTEPRLPSRAGAAVGARWVEGRWPMKHALEFKGPGDRVRVNLGTETYDALTLACWVKVDSVDRKYNALLLTDGYDAGEPHWQIYEDGSLMFSIAYPKTGQVDAGKKLNQIYYSPPVFNLSNQRRWHHLAVTYDATSGEAIQYLDGKEISREVSPHHVPGRKISFGPSEIGNWGLPTERHAFPIRNLNGRMDEFLIYKVALTPEEIQAHYENGKPD